MAAVGQGGFDQVLASIINIGWGQEQCAVTTESFLDYLEGRQDEVFYKISSRCVSILCEPTLYRSVWLWSFMHKGLEGICPSRPFFTVFHVY